MSPEQYNAQILAALLQLQRDVAEIKAAVAGGARSNGAAPGARGNGGGGGVADDRDLDSEYGNFSIKRDPPRWNGQSYVGYKLSETEPEYLDVLASFKDWQADKDEEQGKKDAKGRPTAPMNRKDAARARGWAARLRAGWASGGQSNGGHACGYSNGGGAGRGAPAGSYEQHADGFDANGSMDDVPF
jgi:hypothetical protein